MVDWLVETRMHDAGLNLYQRGGNIGLSNMLYWCLPGFGGPEFFVDLLKRFQDMMRCRTRDAFEAFFRPLYELILPHRSRLDTASLVKGHGRSE